MPTSNDARIQEAKKEINSITSLDKLTSLEIKFLGKKGLINKLLDELKTIPSKNRSKEGQSINQYKTLITALLRAKKNSLGSASIEKSLSESIDVTMPSESFSIGSTHPISKIIWELTDIFERMDYEIVEGPEVETDYYNFEVLNIPKDHPARDLQDTFFFKNGLLPRTHTSAMQVRAMQKRKPPFKVAVPGWVYRSEREDATHAASFHHYEGFAVGKDISFSDLKGTLYTFLRELLGKDTELKFRASYFPYVEPCAEVSISCPHCKKKGCKACGGSGWLEVMGSGMIHPVVLKNAGIDPAEYSGFAYCFGVTRLAMIKYQIDDIRLFTGNDIRFLKQFI
jgi:phenylalanyl-tRNA synthetase alpha chain